MTNASDIAALVAALPDDAEVTIVRVTRGNNRGPGLASRRPQGAGGVTRAADIVADLRAFATGRDPVYVQCDDIIDLCDRYERAVELLHMLDKPDARHPDVAAFLEGEAGS